MANAPKSTKITKDDEPVDKRVAIRLDKLDQGVEHLTTAFKAVKETNSLIVIVLFVGFMGLLVAIFLAGIGALNSNADSNDALNNSIQGLLAEQKASEKSSSTQQLTSQVQSLTQKVQQLQAAQAK